MDLNENPADRAFRREVQHFFETEMPPALRAKGYGLEKPTREELVEWHRIMHRRGWGVPAWPREFGGPGWTVGQQVIFEEEYYLAGAPRYMPQINMIGPVLQRYGTKAQQERFLLRIATLDDWWCQGYSEPGAGSDLAALKTRARRDGDEYVVTGQKIWTSGSYWANWIFALVRTSDEGKPAAGISFLLIDMKSPGITARHIKGIDGAGTLATVFFDEVRVPVENRVHEENQGWTVAKYLLGFERTGQAAVGQCKLFLKLLKRVATRTLKNDRPVLDDPVFRRRVAGVEMELLAHQWTLLRTLSPTAQPHQFSILKNRGAEIQQSLTALMLECAAPGLANAIPAGPATALENADMPTPAAILAAHLDFRKVTIYAGTTEIQNGIIAKAVMN